MAPEWHSGGSGSATSAPWVGTGLSSSSSSSKRPSMADDERAVRKADRRLFFAAALAHGGARVLAKATSAPLERVKICLQVSAASHVAADAAAPSKAAPGLTRTPLLGPFGLVRTMLSTQGPWSLWRGAGTHITGACIGTATRLAMLRTTQMWAMPGGGGQYAGLDAYLRRCTFVYAAGAVALLAAYPLDVAYTCLAADMASPRRFRSARHLASFVIRERGILWLYRGFPLCLATAVPFVAVSTAAHDILAPRLLRRLGQAPGVDPAGGPVPASAHLYPWNLLVGASAGFLAQSATYPLDTIRRRWQMACVLPRGAVAPTLRETASALFASGGWRGLYAGYSVNALKLIPELLVLSCAYTQINQSGYFV